MHMRTCSLYWRHMHARSASNQADLEVMETSKQVPKAPPRCVVSLVGNQHVTINNGSLNSLQAEWAASGCYSISHTQCLPYVACHSSPRATWKSSASPKCPNIIAVSSCHNSAEITGSALRRCICFNTRVVLKAVLKGGNKDGKTFTVRGVDTAAIFSCDDMKC